MRCNSVNNLQSARFEPFRDGFSRGPRLLRDGITVPGGCEPWWYEQRFAADGSQSPNASALRARLETLGAQRSSQAHMRNILFTGTLGVTVAVVACGSDNNSPGSGRAFVAGGALGHGGRPGAGTTGGLGTSGMSSGGAGVGGAAAGSGALPTGGGSSATAGATTGGSSGGGPLAAGGPSQGGAPATGGMAGASGKGGAGGGAGTTGSAGQTGGGKNPWIAFDQCSVVSRSNIVLAHANTTTTELMPIGNGSLGAAVWAAGGFTAQLNRADTMPDRKSPGWLTIPGLAELTGASDFKGTLDLCNGMLIESGGGMTAKIYVRADSDELVIDVTGADPSSSQSASVTVNWGSRNPTAAASGAVATLSESWMDGGTWSSNQKFGSLAALTVAGRSVTASGSGKSINVSFQPNADGSFRVICGSPKFDGSTAAATVASTLFGTDAANPDLAKTHTDWWHGFWNRVGLTKITTSDGSGEYYENLRAIFLYAHASESRGERPGSQAGVADFYNYSHDDADWNAAAYWFWNLRMQVAASMTSGAFDLNQPLFKLYSSNVANIQSWTKQRMGNRAGICVPETMRFNGNGWWYDGNHSCDEASSPSYNALTLSTGSEIGLWMWRDYLMTGDKMTLSQNFPFMLEAARFLHGYATTASNGKLQTSPSNAHEQQWAVTTSMNDAAAMRAFFPAVVAAAAVVGSNDSLIASLQSDIDKLPELPRTNTSRNQVTTPASDGTNLFANSYAPTASTHNVENDDLEPVWPYDLVSDADATVFEMAKRTYGARLYKDANDWSNDAITAARLGLATEWPARLSAIVSKYQVYPCGLAAFDTTKMKEPYIEAVGVLTTAINEAIATDFDGTLRLAPALPSTWNVSGTVYIQRQSRVHVQYMGGALAFGVVEAGSTATLTVKNPWNGAAVVVLDDAGTEVVAPTSAATLQINAVAGRAYLVKKSSDAAPALVQVAGTAATAVKKLGSRTIGVP